MSDRPVFFVGFFFPFFLNSSMDSEEEYIPNPHDGSTESENSLELCKKKKGALSDSRRKSSSQSKVKHSESGSESSRERRKFPCHNTVESSSESLLGRNQKTPFERSYAPTQKFPNYGNENEMVSTSSQKDLSMAAPLEEEQSVYVNPVLKKGDGSRSCNKKYFCYDCRKFVQKMSRHLWRKHQDETDVAKALSFPKNSKERRLQLDYIRNKGNFEHNTDVLETQKGNLIPWKQPQKKI